MSTTSLDTTSSCVTSPCVALIALVKPWHHALFSSVKKDIRNEHLKLDKSFFHAHFGTRVLQRLTVEDLMAVYPAVIEKGHEKLAEFIINRWLLKHVLTYNLFEAKLKQLNSDVSKITEIADDFAEVLLSESSARFGVVDTYLFTIFNSVQFSPKILESLREAALKELQK